ncbi:hypothetical protein AA313_de0206257 [Arthrobotrys entomopaga]|nr:hypothetical protein AA313_de0206257 [Arthrobotrys entomopaga]
MTKSSVSSYHEDQEYEQLSNSIMGLKVSSNRPPQPDFPYPSFEELDKGLTELPSLAKILVQTSPITTQELLIDDSPRSVKAAPVVRLSDMELRLLSRGYGSGKEVAGSSSQNGSTNTGSNASTFLTPPHQWGTRNGGAGGGYGGDGDGNEDNSPRELKRECGAKRQGKKKYACPAAKGDPFHNRNCLGVTFPNPAKVRQHLTCKDHYNINSTTYLPDQVRDPNGWNEMLTYIYPGQEVPSSDEDFHAALDVIQIRGAGPGKPDFLSYFLRMLHSGYQDRGHLGQTIALLEAIRSRHDVNATSQLEESDWPPYFTTFLESDSLSDFTSGQETETYTPTSLQTTHIQPSVVASDVFSNFAHQHNGPQAFPLVSAVPDAMGNAGVSHVASSTGPDNRHQADDGGKIDLNNGPSVESHSAIIVHIPHRGYRLVYDVDRATVIFETWLRKSACPDFSFQSYSVEWLATPQSYIYENWEDMWGDYWAVRNNFPDCDFQLCIRSRAGSSREGAAGFSGFRGHRYN